MWIKYANVLLNMRWYLLKMRKSQCAEQKSTRKNWTELKEKFDLYYVKNHP